MEHAELRRVEDLVCWFQQCKDFTSDSSYQVIEEFLTNYYDLPGRIFSTFRRLFPSYNHQYHFIRLSYCIASSSSPLSSLLICLSERINGSIYDFKHNQTIKTCMSVHICEQPRKLMAPLSQLLLVHIANVDGLEFAYENSKHYANYLKKHLTNFFFYFGWSSTHQTSSSRTTRLRCKLYNQLEDRHAGITQFSNEMFAEYARRHLNKAISESGYSDHDHSLDVLVDGSADFKMHACLDLSFLQNTLDKHRFPSELSTLVYHYLKTSCCTTQTIIPNIVPCSLCFHQRFLDWFAELRAYPMSHIKSRTAGLCKIRSCLMTHDFTHFAEISDVPSSILYDEERFTTSALVFASIVWFPGCSLQFRFKIQTDDENLLCSSDFPQDVQIYSDKHSYPHCFFSEQGVFRWDHINRLLMCNIGSF